MRDLTEKSEKKMHIFEGTGAACRIGDPIYCSLELSGWPVGPTLEPANPYYSQELSGWPVGLTVEPARLSGLLIGPAPFGIHSNH